MPRNSNSTSSKNQGAVSNKLLREARAEQKRQLTEQWRFLRKIGVYNSKEAAAQKRLTDSRIREIKKRMKEVQTMKTYDYKGRVIRPVTEKTVQTKRGSKITYDFNKHFTFVRTKNKTPVTEGVRKTKKGYIVEKPVKIEKVRINKRGEIIETKGKMTRKRNKMRGREILRLVNDLQSGKIVLKKNQYIAMHRWGSLSDALEFDGPQFIRYITGLEQEMREDMFDQFTSRTYVEFIQYGDDGF